MQEGLGVDPYGGCNGREAAVLGKEKAQLRTQGRHYGTIPIRVQLRQPLQLRQVGTQVSQHDGNRPGSLRRSRCNQDVLGRGRHARHGHDGCAFVNAFGVGCVRLANEQERFLNQTKICLRFVNVRAIFLPSDMAQVWMSYRYANEQKHIQNSLLFQNRKSSRLKEERYQD